MYIINYSEKVLVMHLITIQVIVLTVLSTHKNNVHLYYPDNFQRVMLSIFYLLLFRL